MEEDEFSDESLEPNPALNEITNLILGACFEVHSYLGPGYQERVYCNALSIELARRNIMFNREVTFSVGYKGEVVGTGRTDFVIDNLVLLEIKAVETLNSLFTAQTISYLKATGIKIALLINFNVSRLKDGIKRIAL